MGRLFGTDGVRGTANREVTAELALDLAVAAAHVLGEVGEFAGHRPRAVVGRDPRASGEFLAAAVVAGLASAGVDVDDAGVLPTPGVAALVADTGADLGVVLSASHNPMPDNGIKFFAKGGHKLPDEVEDDIERRLGEDWQRPTGAAVGRVRPLADATDRYVARLLASVPNRLDGLKVVVDWPTAPPAPRRRAPCGRRARRSSSSARSRTGSTSTTGTAPPTSTRSRRRSSRRAPTRGSRTTGTPTAAWPWTPPAATSTATRSWVCSRSRSGSVVRCARTPSSRPS